MKKIITLALAMFAIVRFANAQTTQSDYDYVTTGFKEDMYKVAGLRLGYYLQPVGSKVEITKCLIIKGAHLFSFKINNAFRAYMVKVWDNEGNRSYYCIPSSDSDKELLSVASKAITESDKDTQELIDKLLKINNFK